MQYSRFSNVQPGCYRGPLHLFVRGTYWRLTPGASRSPATAVQRSKVYAGVMEARLHLPGFYSDPSKWSYLSSQGAEVERRS